MRALGVWHEAADKAAPEAWVSVGGFQSQGGQSQGGQSQGGQSGGLLVLEAPRTLNGFTKMSQYDKLAVGLSSHLTFAPPPGFPRPPHNILLSALPTPVPTYHP